MIDVHRGTPEAAWSASGALPELPELDWGPPGRVVVVAPHPDDEVLGAGGTIHRLAAAGFDVEVVAVTDGEGSHPRSTAISPECLRARRPRETATALARLGVKPTAVDRLGLADGSLPGQVDRLAAVLAQRARGAAWLLSVWRGDGHPDHEATGSAAARAAAISGVRLVEFPVWMWHWAAPGDPLVPWIRAHCVPFAPGGGAAKAMAVRAFASQTTRLGPEPEDGPILPPAVLAHFTRPFEVMFA